MTNNVTAKLFMTYRYVPTNWLFAVQLATLLVTALIGGTLLLTPPRTDVKLTTLEQGMNQHWWAYTLIAAGSIGFIAEICAKIWSRRWQFSVVVYSHTVCAGVMAGYSSAAMVSVLRWEPWNFGAPALGMLMVAWHALYAKRRRPGD